MAPSDPLTLVLDAIRRGEADPARDLVPLVYDELRGIARGQLSRLGEGQTLQATALVHEAFVRLLGEDSGWEDRRHFFGSCALAMRHILVDAARARGRQKRGGEWRRVTLGELSADEEERSLELLALDQALGELESADARQHEIVMLRYFAGLTIEETARAMAIGTATVDRHWRFARAWLRRKVEGNAR